jgi:outer membrane protein TolC
MPSRRSRRAGPLPLRFLAPCLCLAGSLLGAGCATPNPDRVLHYQSALRPAVIDPSSAGPPVEVGPGDVKPTAHAEPAARPARQARAERDVPAVLPPPTAEAAPAEQHLVPVSLDAVLHLAEGGNAQIGQAREKVRESQLEQDLACKSWLPQIVAGIGYYRHEGGIQNEDGTLQHSSTGALFPGVEIRTGLDLKEATINRVDAERKMWQSRGELSRVTNETLLEAVSTYFDLLAARHGEAVAVELEAFHQKLLTRAEKMLQPNDQSARVLVEGLRAELSARKQARSRLHQQGDAAAAKLAYLLDLPPDVQLVPVDPEPKPIDLVDATRPTAELVARAIAYGPGVRELQALLNVIQGGMARLEGPAALLPAVQVCVNEGLFLAGPGATLNSDNRFDAAVQLRWNITDFLTAREKKRIAESRLRQAEWSMQDLQGKLTLGVKEAQSAIVSGREEVTHGTEMIGHAREFYELSNKRLEENVQGATVGEVQGAIRGLETARLGYLSAVTSYNKAQARLLLLLGRGAGGPPCEPHR